MPSITGDQAFLASDGKYWLVIANQDPGVPNWLGTQQHAEGLIFSRFQGVDAGPDYQVHIVKLNELEALLPSDTPTVTVKDRQLELGRRQDHMIRRWAP